MDNKGLRGAFIVDGRFMKDVRLWGSHMEENGLEGAYIEHRRLIDNGRLWES